MNPGANSGNRPLQHPGEELVHVLSGEVAFRVADQEFNLGPGDSLHFSGEVAHHWENQTDEVTLMVWVALRNG
jgi:uncharacterized cupin superfamily protein